MGAHIPPATSSPALPKISAMLVQRTLVNGVNYATRPQPQWIGNVAAGYAYAGGNTQLSNNLHVVPMAHSVNGMLRFEVWAQGITDRHFPNRWQTLDVAVRYRIAGQRGFNTVPVAEGGRTGNNVFYQLQLMQLNPYYNERVANGREDASTVIEVIISVNGVDKVADNGEPFRLQFNRR
jgi:hypothetical protein